jgi:LppP/LprE lipoprotein
MLKIRIQLMVIVALPFGVMALIPTNVAPSDGKVVKIDSGTIAGAARAQAAIWLDDTKPASWNMLGLSIPAAPRIQRDVDPRCRESARPPELEEDKGVRNQGWNLVGAYQGGWQIRVIRGTAGYDGMCRPRQYQDFVFVGGVFAGTLSPQAMDSRTDGALNRVFLQSSTRLTAEYDRYAPKDPLCCPSRTTSVVFDMTRDAPVVRPVSASTSKR